jgi:hypothetical protein
MHRAVRGSRVGWKVGTSRVAQDARQLRSGDTLVGWKLDRLSRSLKDLLTILERVNAAGAKFKSLTEAIDTSGPAGRMLMQMLGSFAEFEREMIRERTRAGLHEARAQGHVPGRSRKSPTSKRRRSSKPYHPGARRPPNSPACSKFIVQPSRGSFLRHAPVSDPGTFLNVTRPRHTAIFHLSRRGEWPSSSATRVYRRIFQKSCGADSGKRGSSAVSAVAQSPLPPLIGPWPSRRATRAAS